MVVDITLISSPSRLIIGMFANGVTKSGGLSPMAELKSKLEQCVQGPRAKTLTEAMYTSTVDLARLVSLLAIVTNSWS